MAIKVYIDQGHNPRNPNAGAEGNGQREQDIVYRIGLLLAQQLRQNGSFEVKLSRPTPETQLGTSTATSLMARTSAANAFGADIFISLHTNAAVASSATGSEAFVFSNPSAASRLAFDILMQLKNTTGLPNRGVAVRPGLYVLRKTAMPAVLVELGFITNPGDAALMVEDPDLFATGVYRGILEHFQL